MEKICSKTFGSMLLFVGASVGGGMLALPLTTADFGLMNAFFLFIICYLFMQSLALISLESILYEKDSHSGYLAMVQNSFGSKGKHIISITYALFLYCSLAALISGGGQVFYNLFANTSYSLSSIASGFYITGMLSIIIIILNRRHLDYLNRLLVLGKFSIFSFIVFFSVNKVNITTTFHSVNYQSFSKLPILVSAFGAHGVIPSVRKYLNNDIKKIRLSLMGGSLITLLIYLVWECVILGTLPSQGPHNIINIANSAHPIINLQHSLTFTTGISYVPKLFMYFSFFAIFCSYIVTAMSLYDFYTDIMHDNRFIKKLILLFLTIVPALLFTIYYPDGFLFALGYVGFFMVILFGIFPSLVIWRARYINNTASSYTVSGGKPLLFSVIICSIFIIILQVCI